jgi:tetratricopeptide (TPR) repeat protein
MGGMMGGMGGMGGGMGGMGGGMGFMGGGMGFMNVPNRRILPAGVVPPVPAGGFQAFAVPDDLTLSAKDVPPASVNKAVVKPDNKADGAEKPQAEIPPSGDPAVLDDYFAAHQPAPAALREAVRSRMSNRQYGQVVALIQAALRHGQVQPWMYEAMVLAMQAAERPDEEIERAVMSAVDFAQNSLDLMYLGIYLQRLGLQPRALQLFRQVSKLEPLRYEPYWYGLQSAQRLNDLDGIKWAVTGILSQAYAKKQAEIWQTAGRVANATLEKLRTEKRTAELKAFQAALDAAVQRDVVAIVHFTGEADIDILIEEPSGSVCSLRNPRTTGGGILLDRPASAAAGDSSEGDSEVYVCPKGFDGTYRMLVRRVWGTVTAGKVTVEVYTHCRSKDAAGLRKTIPLDKNGEALVVFELKNGRRTEPLQAEQVANAAASQLVVTQHILGQQLDAAASPSALQSLILSRQQQGGGLGGFPFFVGGVVGYQPVIETVPAGASLSVSAVVSADRRYVRVSALPNFQGIAAVHVFNMATGQDQNLANDNRIGNQGFSGTNFGGGR